MYQVAHGRLAAAVSQAGGLGVIGAAFMEPEDLRREIRLVRETTDRPFGVDILFAEVAKDDPSTTGYTQQVEDHIAVIFEERVPVLVFGAWKSGAYCSRLSRFGDQSHVIGWHVTPGSVCGRGGG